MMKFLLFLNNLFIHLGGLFLFAEFLIKQQKIKLFLNEKSGFYC